MNAINTLHERSYEINAAKHLWLQVIDELQVKCIKKDYTINQFTTSLYYLTDKHLTARGVGKGLTSLNIDISARFEALEYYLSGYCCNPYPIVFESSLEISKKYPLILERCDSENIMCSSNRTTALPWAIYEDIVTKEQYATPLATVDLFYRSNLLQDDCFDYTNASVYAASNGLSSGSTYEESVIHGALELIERDAYSYFLVDTYLLNKPIQIVNQTTLPDDLISLINNVEINYKNKIFLLKMPSRFGVYVYLAAFLNPSFEISPRGAGASLNAKHAIERAIYELIQSYNLMHGSYVENKINIQRINKNVLIPKFLEFNLKQILKNSKEIHFDNHPYKNNFKTLSDYLSQLIDLIYAHSSLLVNIIYQNKNGLTCSRVIIPEIEEFFLATHYLTLKPKPAMDSYIQNESNKKFFWSHYN